VTAAAGPPAEAAPPVRRQRIAVAVLPDLGLARLAGLIGSAALHLSAIGLVLALLARPAPREPEREPGVALVWADADGTPAGPGDSDEASAPVPEPSPAPAPPAHSEAPVPVPPTDAAPLSAAARDQPPVPPVPRPSPPPPVAVAEAHDPAPADAAPDLLPMPPPAPPAAPARRRTAAARQAGSGEAASAVVGAGYIAAVTSPPRPLETHRNAPPDYPLTSRRNGETGNVRLILSVDDGGKVVGAEVERSSGYPALDAAAQRAVLRWRFHPAVRDGAPVAATLPHTVSFVLER
jgi:protein TonB